MSREKSLVHIPPPIGEHFSVSKIRRFEPVNPVSVSSGMPSLSDIEAQGVVPILAQLHDASADFNHRSHDFLRQVVSTSYAVAIYLKHRPAAWRDFCNDPFWRNHRQGPKASNQRTALRHTLVRVFGKGDKRASDWKGRLVDLFDKNVPPAEIFQELARKSLTGPRAKNAKDNRVRSQRAGAEVLKIEGRKIAGQYDLGLLEGKNGHSYKIQVEDGLFARVSIVYELYESREAPISIKRARIRAKLEQAFVSHRKRSRVWIEQFRKRKAAGR